MRTLRKKIIAILIIALFVVIPGVRYTPAGVEVYTVMAESGSPSNLTGEQINYREGPNAVTWFSGEFRKYFDPLDDSFINEGEDKREFLQEKLGKNSEYHIRGTNCMFSIAKMLEMGVSFAGVTLHMTQDIVTCTDGMYPVHISIGTEENPFNGIFDGNGYEYNIQSGDNAGVYTNSNIVTNSEGFTGFFGAIQNAIIMNLTVTATASHFVGSESQTHVGVIAAAAKESAVVNCVNKVDLTQVTGASGVVVGAIVGKPQNAKIINCIDTMNYGDLVGMPDVEGVIKNSLSYSDWAGVSDKDTFVKEMNNNIFYGLRSFGHFAETYFWGIGDDGLPLFNALNALFDDRVVYFEILKNSVLGNMQYFFNDTYDFLYDGNVTIDAATVEKLEEILGEYSDTLETVQNGDVFEWNSVATVTKLYEELLSEIDTLVSAVDADILSFSLVEFALEISSISDTACLLFDEIYWVYAIQDAKNFEIDSKTFAWDAVLSSQNDSLNLITGNNKRAENARNAVKARFLQFQTDWETATTFEADGSIKDTSAFTLSINEMMRDAIHDFDKIYSDWANHPGNTVLIIVLVSSVVVLAGGIVLLIFLLRKSKRTNMVYIGGSDMQGRQARKISEKADAISQIIEAQREKSEAIANIQREKARLVEMAHKVQMETTHRQQAELAKVLAEKAEMAQRLDMVQKQEMAKKVAEQAGMAEKTEAEQKPESTAKSDKPEPEGKKKKKKESK